MLHKTNRHNFPEASNSIIAFCWPLAGLSDITKMWLLIAGVALLLVIGLHIVYKYTQRDSEETSVYRFISVTPVNAKNATLACFSLFLAQYCRSW